MRAGSRQPVQQRRLGEIEIAVQARQQPVAADEHGARRDRPPRLVVGEQRQAAEPQKKTSAPTATVASSRRRYVFVTGIVPHFRLLRGADAGDEAFGIERAGGARQALPSGESKEQHAAIRRLRSRQAKILLDLLDAMAVRDQDEITPATFVRAMSSTRTVLQFASHACSGTVAPNM